MTGEADLARFRTIVTGWFGLSLAGMSDADLAALLDERADGSPASYLDHLETRPGGERAVLAARLTIPETYLYRHVEQFRAVAEVAVPHRAQATGPRLSMLSAACATGDEAYTLAMVARDALPPGWTVQVTGVDLNPDVLRLAERGRFSAWAMRATPERARRRWFHADGDAMVLDDEIRRTVRFVDANLLDDDPRWWAPDAYDVIFCRNAVMYLTAEHASAVVRRLVAALKPGGFLFLGHAETAYGRVDGLDLRHSHGTFYFQRGVGRSAETIAPTPVIPEKRTAETPAQSPTEAALGLLREERFVDALALVAEEPGPEASLLRAVLLTDLDRLPEAEAQCRRMLDANGLDAGAHYLLAVCREGAGDPEAAESHARTAAYLDPGFAMPRLRLGLLARARGDHKAARHEFTAALTLLAAEREERLLLFGGGFTRSALTALCRTGAPA